MLSESADAPEVQDGAAPETTGKVVKKKTTKKKTTSKKKKATGAGTAKKLRVRQVRSTVRRLKTFRDTLTALGIKHHQDEVVVTDSPSTQGMLRKVRHLITVTPED